MQKCEYAADCGRRETDECVLSWDMKTKDCYLLDLMPCGHPRLYGYDADGPYADIVTTRCSKCEEEANREAQVATASPA